MAVDDGDCDCDLPEFSSSPELEHQNCHYNGHLRVSQQSESSTGSGFSALVHLSRLSGTIFREVSPLRMRYLIRTLGRKTAAQRLRETIDSLDQQLDAWTEFFPHISHETANMREQSFSDIALQMICRLLHAGCIINLWRPLLSGSMGKTTTPRGTTAYHKCLNAARECIRSSEGISEIIPSSHFLAFCAHYLMLSGIILYVIVCAHSRKVTH